MDDSDEKKRKLDEELFMVPRRWDELDLVEKMKIKQGRGGFAGSASEQAYLERMMKLSKKQFLGTDE